MRDWLTWLFELDPEALTSSSNWRLAFAGQYPAGVLLALVAGLVVVGYLVVRSYRREGNTPTAAKVILTGLRLGVVAIIVALLFRPALVLEFVRMQYATVAVVLDDSASMGNTDRYNPGRTDDEPRALAEMIGVKAAELDEMPRRELLRRALQRPDGALARLARNQDLVLMRFAPGEGADYVRPLGIVPAGARRGGDASVDLTALGEALDALSVEGRRTDLSAAVDGALARTAGRRLSGLVIVSDGQVTEDAPGAGLKRARRRAAARRAGLCCVCVGRPRRHSRNVTVVSARPPARRIRRGRRATFAVKLLHTLPEPHDVTVELRRRRPDATDWATVARSEAVHLPADAAEDDAAPAPRTVEIILTPEEVGTELGEFVYQARIAPLDDEADTDDNAASTYVELCDETVNVLLVGHAGWEFQYLRNFLLRQKRKDPDGEMRDAFRVTVWQQDADKGFNQDASTGMKLDHLPRTLDVLIGSPKGRPHPGYDVVILYDPKPTQDGVDKTFADVLKAYVQEHGGGLCYIAGRKYTEAVMGNEEVFDALRDLLPVEVGRNQSLIEERIHSTRPEAHRVVLREAGREHPLMRLADDPDASARVWSVLPGIHWSHAVYRRKPLARVLAVSSNPWRQTHEGQPEPVVAVHTSGRGRVLYVGFDSTWRWRPLADGAVFRRFWTNAARYLGPLRISQVLITSPQRRYDVGERVPVEVEAYDQSFEPITRRTYRILCRRTDGEDGAREITLAAVDPDGAPGLYRTSLEHLEAGSYELVPTADIPPGRAETDRFRVVRRRREMRRPEANPALLRQLVGPQAAERCLPLEQMDRLETMLSREPLTFRRQQQRDLLSARRPAAILLSLVVLLLAVEWFVRKRYNMA
ncbi:MAG: hypothetical protein KGY99_03555 [Phycisphaerae bacterium]|nr:hypothetical protein [Phycisphaerae bacterium]